MNRIAARKEREERKARVENQPLGKGDTVAYEVRFAPHMPPKRTLGEVLAIGASGVKVRLVSGEELWLKRSQVEIVATRAMRRAERIRRESEDEQSRKAKEIIMTNTRPKEPLTVPENDVAPPTVTPPRRCLRSRGPSRRLRPPRRAGRSNLATLPPGTARHVRFFADGATSAP